MSQNTTAVVIPDTNTSIKEERLLQQSCYDVVRRCFRESKLQKRVRYNKRNLLNAMFVSRLDWRLLYSFQFGDSIFVRVYPKQPKYPELHFGLYSSIIPTPRGDMQTLSLYSKCKRSNLWLPCRVWIHSRTEPSGRVSQMHTNHLALIDSPYAWANSIKSVLVDIANGVITCRCCVPV
jgi:hypothetical protein